MRTFLLRLASLVTRGRLDVDLDDEVRAHLELLAADYERQGLPPEDARHAARRAFGGVEPMKDAYRDRRGLPWVDDLTRDVRYAYRALRRDPGFTATAVLTLALGIGASTAIFTVVNTLFLKRLPVDRPEELVVFTIQTPTGALSPNFSYPLYREFRSRADGFVALAASGGVSRRTRVSVGGGSTRGESELVQAERVSGNFFSTLGVRALIGRTLTDDDGRTTAAQPATVLSYGFWSRRFGRDPTVLGRTIAINDVPFSIVGVAPPEFFGVDVGRSPDLWYPLEMVPRVLASLGGPDVFLASRTNEWLRVFGRVRPGIGEARALAQVEATFQRDLADRRQAAPAGRGPSPRRLALESGASGLSLARRPFRPLALLLTVSVSLVLLVACANVATLLLARAASRQKEIAMRLALGADRWRVIRQLVTEGLFLAMVSGAAGLIVSAWGIRLVLAYMSEQQAAIRVPIDSPLVFAAAASLVAALLFSLAPALSATRAELGSRLKQTEQRGKSPRVALGNVLVVAQVAISLILLTAAGLFGRTLYNLATVDTGLDLARVAVFSLEMPATYTDERRATLYRALLDRLRALPAVSAASFSMFGLMSGNNWGDVVQIPGHTSSPGEDMNVRGVVVGPDFFDSVGTSILAGRGVTNEDVSPRPRIAVVNRTMARRFFGTDMPLGRHFTIGRWPDQPFEIIGVAEDATYRAIREEPQPIVYVPFLQMPGPTMSASVQFEVRAAAGAAEITSGIRRAVADVDPRVPIATLEPLQAIVDRSLRQERLVAGAAGLFSSFAVVLACIGLYGLRAYVVAGRTAEIGIRLALGASGSRVCWMMLRGSLYIVVAGAAIALPVVLAVARSVRGLLFGVDPLDTVTITGATLMLAAVGIIAGFIPAWRATKVDPLVALRSE